MKRYILLTIALSASTIAAAQQDISKELEVTRAYTPRVGRAEKLPAPVDMTDTVRMRPEVAYGITPTAWPAAFPTQRFAPAGISTASWERPRVLWLRAGAGFPIQTTADLYFTPHMGEGRTLGIFANHRGHYSKIENDTGAKPNSTEVYGGAGVFGSLRLGRSSRYSLAGSLSFDNRLHSMYGYPANFAPPHRVDFKWTRAAWNRVGADIGFGDDFTDTSRLNFHVSIEGGHTHRGGELRDFILRDPSSYVFRTVREPSQTDLGIGLRMGKMFSDRHGFEGGMRVRYVASSLDYFETSYRIRSNDNVISYNELKTSAKDNRSASGTLAVRYILSVDKFSVRAGGDIHYMYNRRFEQNRLRLRPAFEASYDPFGGSLVPYATLSSRIMDGDLETLSRLNPYVDHDRETGLASEMRVGLKGNAGGILSYELSAGASLLQNYTMFVSSFLDYMPVRFYPVVADGRQYTVGAGLGLHGMGGFSAKFHGNWYKYDFETFGLPDFDAGAQLAWSYRDKLTISAGAKVTGRRKYLDVEPTQSQLREPAGDVVSISIELPYRYTVNRLPAVVDISMAVEAKIMDDFWVFVEGQNLAGQHLYPYPYYRGRGAGVVGGIKVVF